MDDQKQNLNLEVTTNEIMDFLREHMVIKSEFKDELSKMVTKDELKDELGKMATKDDLRQSLNKQKLDILDAMDDKLANLKGDMVVLMRKEDKKVVSLIELLKNKKIITTNEANGLLELEPFPQLILGT